MCIYPVSWTYADKLHTSLWHTIYFKNRKTSSKTGFTLVCYSFDPYYISHFRKSQTKFSCNFTFFPDKNTAEDQAGKRSDDKELQRKATCCCHTLSICLIHRIPSCRCPGHPCSLRCFSALPHKLCNICLFLYCYIALISPELLLLDTTVRFSETIQCHSSFPSI